MAALSSCSTGRASSLKTVSAYPVVAAQEGKVSAPGLRADSRPGDYIVGEGDVIQILVMNHLELTLKVLVPPSGRITYPFLGDLDVAGVSIPALRDRIRDGLSEGYVPNPQVSVNVESIGSRKVYVLGEVSSPKVISLDTEMDALGAILLAGGFQLTANKSSVLLIRRLEGQHRKMDVLDLKAFLSNEGPTQNVMLQKGDILYVPPSKIANVTRFFGRLSTILAPIMPNMMEALILAPRVMDALKGETEEVQVQ